MSTMKISLLIFSFGLLLVAVNGQWFVSLYSNDLKNVWTDYRGAEDPEYTFEAGSEIIIEFNFAGTVPHGLRLKDMQNQLIPGVTNNNVDSPPQPVNLTWANPVPGHYYYVCAFHPTMKGFFNVTAAPGTMVPTSTPWLNTPSSAPSSVPSSVPSAPSSVPSTAPSSVPSSVPSAPSSVPPTAPSSVPSPVPTTPTSVPSAPSTTPTPSSSPSATPSPNAPAPSGAPKIVVSSLVIVFAAFSLVVCLV